MSKRLLLISSSNVHGFGYLDHAEAEIREVVEGERRVVFVPFALADRTGYTAKVRERLGRMDISVTALHTAADLDRADAVFIGGGNTWRLLKMLYDRDLVRVIRERVAAGLTYIGSSAGTNIAAPTIKTTNDMPIVEPSSFTALGLVGFQINPHYLDPDPSSTHQGETREQRIREFLEENATPVVALREGAMLRIENGQTRLVGSANARIFRRGVEPIEVEPESEIAQFIA